MKARPQQPRRGSDKGLDVLLVDIGNTRIKWARWREGRLSPMHAAAHARWTREHYARRVFSPRGIRVSRILVASVAGARVDGLVKAAAQDSMGLEPQFMRSVRQAAGVTTRYREPWQLGVDRFVAAIGAHHMAGARSVCVVNAGTTVTIDLVDGRGVHRGGAIMPGPAMMVASLKRGTAGIERRARERSRRGTRTGSIESPFARSTKDAIWQGALYALGAAIERVCSEARRELGRNPLVLLTGGGAERLDHLLRVRHVNVPDLVLRGVAVRAGLALR